MATKPRRPASERRPQDWLGTLIHEQREHRAVSVNACVGDETYRPADSPILWSVGVVIEHTADLLSIYRIENGPAPKYANGTDPATIEITIGHPRGSKKAEQTFSITCELAHLDALAEALTAALSIARRDGTIPIAKGIRPWPTGKNWLRGEKPVA